MDRVPSIRKQRSGGATALVAVVLVGAAGGFAAYELYGRAKTARAAATRAEAELVVTRDRAKAAEDKVATAEAALASEKAAKNEELEKLRGENALLAEEKKKVAEKSDALAAELAKTFGKDEGDLTDAGGRLTLNLLDKVLFRTGEAKLTPAGEKVLRRVGAALNKYPDRQMWVIGHTDNIPIKSPEFPSNWELSTARALSVVHFLVDEVKVDPRRLAAAGFGPYRPVSKSNRAKNRRIELVLFPADVKYVRP